MKTSRATTKEKKSVGRPMKYGRFIENLEDDVVYTPAAIVRHGELLGLFPATSYEKKKKAKLRIRHTLARLSVNHQFSERGDDLVFLRGQAPTRGWYGWRWKRAAKLPYRMIIPPSHRARLDDTKMQRTLLTLNDRSPSLTM